MKTAQHTPGPWRVTEPHCNGYIHKYIQSSNGLFVATTNKDDFLKDQIEANARLIAAAPELLEALEMILHMEVKGYELIDRLQFYSNGRAISDKARAAIAKAKGGA